MILKKEKLKLIHDRKLFKKENPLRNKSVAAPFAHL
jgi:hypothetical protein